MSKVKLTKGELKRQRDSLHQFERFLPTLQLKKQQLQMEILSHYGLLEKTKHEEELKRKSFENWLLLLAEPQVDISKLLTIKEINLSSKNIAGIDIPVFESCEFKEIEYDLFTTPLWVDHAISAFRELISIRSSIKAIEESILILKQELRITTQRVNLFEKVKIPEAEEAIRLIKIYIGDQLTNAVGRSKIAKRKIEYANEREFAPL
ncbi:MAG: V-type ATP synthase subunit D [Candidatus Omnitrophica bacterium]|jgi:V/A-type H+-transporting ATPase subunit D|nr:V-type ATP synthase subunit D [Candidatus Omnitrophota bacterium]